MPPRLSFVELSEFLIRFAPNELAKLELPSKQKELQKFLKESILGKGVYGVAFDIGGGRVLKITKDSADARSCQAVMDAGGIEGVAKIYDVFKFVMEHRWIGSYGIVLEKVISFSEMKERLSKDAGKRLIKMLDYAFGQLYDTDKFPKLNEFPEESIRKAAKRSVLTKEEIDIAVRWGDQLVRTLIELRRLNITVWDMHPWNAGFKINGEDLDLTLFDLGNRSFKGDLEVRLAANT